MAFVSAPAVDTAKTPNDMAQPIVTRVFIAAPAQASLVTPQSTKTYTGEG